MPTKGASVNASKKTVSLVLGSGGARGLTHIGAIHWLEENGFEITSISGCSMGALVGGIYAAGKLDEFEHWVRAIDKMSILSLLDISWRSSGLVKGDKIIETLVELVGRRKIEELAIPFTAVAANLDSGKEVWFQSGSLFDAIRASISIPFFFTAFDYNGQNLVDGGVLNPVPIAPTFSDPSDITIAINLGGVPEKLEGFNTNKTEPDNAFDDIRDKITNFFSDFSSGDIEKTQKELGVFEVGMRSFDAMQNTIARQKLAAYPPDEELIIPLNLCDTLDFHLAEQLIEFGYKRAESQLSHLITNSSLFPN